MLFALSADAVFCAAVFFETLAALSILHTASAVPLREELEPILTFYHQKAMPLIAFGANIVPFQVPAWFADATVIASVLFFLFFIAQARRAAAPYDADRQAGALDGAMPTRVEAAIDWALPTLACAVGAFVSALTLLPFLTVPIALWLAARRTSRQPSWFQVSRSYYVNVAAVSTAVAFIIALPHQR